MTKAAVGIVLLAVSGWTAFGQVDAYSLRAKYGLPLGRETFAVLPGIEIVVDYGLGWQACRIQLPSGTKEILDDVVPLWVRGKEGTRMTTRSGTNSFSVVDYERMTIAESSSGGVATGIIVTFKDPACPKASPEF